MSRADVGGGGVYRLFDADGALIYIGSSGDVRVRLTQHRAGSGLTSQADAIRDRFVSHSVEFYPTLSEARIAESDAILSEQPELNRRGIAPRAPESEIGQVIRSVGSERGVSVCELAYLLDMDRAVLERQMFNGSIRIGSLITIADRFGMPLSELCALAEQVAA